MKVFSPLITAACAVLCASGLAAQEAAVLPLDKRPNYQTLTTAGFKLLNRDPRPFNQMQAVDYPTEPCRILLGLGETRSASFQIHGEGNVEFQRHELTPPGTTYPPALPVQDATPVWALGFDCSYPDLPSARAALASMEKMLKVDMTKVDAWIQHQLWESAPALKLVATVPDANADIELCYQPEDQANGQATDCRICFRFRWNAPPAPNPLRGAARPPRPMVRPPQPNQQAQPVPPQ